MLRRFLSTTCTPFHLNSKYSTILRCQNVNQNPAFPTKMKISWLSTTGVQRLKCFNSESLQKGVGIKGVRRRHMSDKLPAKKDPPKVDSTTFFRMTNPELFMDVKSAKTWYLVGFIWVAFGSYYMYLSDKEAKEQEEQDARESLENYRARQQVPSNYGPQRPPSK